MASYEWKHNPKYLFELANCLARCKDVSWNKVTTIYNLCPQQNPNGLFVITSQGLDAIIALGNYYIKSGFQHADIILLYLKRLLSGLLKAKWTEELGEVPFPEKFTFCLNTLLSDISMKTGDNDLLVHQVKEILRLFNVMQNEINGNCDCVDGSKHTCLVKYPIFVGALQSFVRFQNEHESYFCHIFPKHLQCVGIAQHIKRNYNSEVFKSYKLTNLSASDIHMTICDMNKFTKCSSGLSFALIKDISDEVQDLVKENNLINLKKRIKEHQLQFEMFKRFPYAGFNNIIKLTSMYFLHNILCCELGLPLRYIEEIKIFVEGFYLAEQNKLSKNYSTDLSGYTKDKVRMNLLTKAVSVEMLIWSAHNQHLADLLCTHLENILSEGGLSQQFIIMQVPYTIACLNSIGSIAEKYPKTSQSGIRILHDFLLKPASLFINLNVLIYSSDFVSISNDSNGNLIHQEDIVFKMIQSCAIYNLSKSLLVVQQIDECSVQACLTSLSRYLFNEKSIPNDRIKIENIVTALGYISCLIPSYKNSVFYFFYIRLGRHSMEIDVAIINQLGYVLLTTKEMENFSAAFKLMLAAFQETFKSSFSKELAHMLEALLKVLANVAKNLKEVDKVDKLFMWLVEIFVQMYLDESRIERKTNASKKTEINQTKDSLLRIIAQLAVNLPDGYKFEQSHLFQDFFIYCITMGGSKLESQDDSLKKITPKLPTLTTNNVTDYDVREFYYLSTLNMNKLYPTTQEHLKTQLVDFLTTATDNYMMSQILIRLTFSELVYLHSVCVLEVRRLENSTECSLEPIFCYLTNVKLQKDKHNIWECLNKIACLIFDKFSTIMKSRLRDDIREDILIKHAQFLLVHFNNANSNVRHIADKFFSDLIANFPHLLWTEKVLFCMIDILCVLSYSFETGSGVINMEVPHTPYSITFMESNRARREIYNDFNARCQEIIAEAMKWAPAIISSHMQHYFLQGENYLLHCTAGESRNSAWKSLFSKQNFLQIELGEIMSSLIVRSRYNGEMSNTLYRHRNSLEDLVRQFSESIKKACNQCDLPSYENTMRRVTAFAINQTQLQWEIKHILTFSQVHMFTKEAVFTTVQCWDWLCSERPEFHVELLQEILTAWKYTMLKRLGLYAKGNEEQYTLLAQSSTELSVVVNADPHEIWLKYISQIMETAKYGTQDCLEEIVHFLHCILPFAIGTEECLMSKQVEASSARFLLLKSALTLLQADTPTLFVNKLVLRERVYCASLDYFCCLRTFPKNEASSLKNNISTLIEYWSAVYNDIKYFTKDTSSMDAAKEASDIISDLSNISVLSKLKQVPGKKNSILRKVNPKSEYIGFYHDFVNKRKLILLLLAEEVEFLTVWYNPTNDPDLLISGEEKVREWYTTYFSAKKHSHEIARSAWDISPVLAVHLPIRLRKDETVMKELIQRVERNPISVSHIPHAINYFATPENLIRDSSNLMHILTWSNTSPTQALAFFSKKYPQHPITLQYGLRTLLSCKYSELVFYIPQIVQCLHNDCLGYASILLQEISKKSELFCHQLLWNMKANMFTDVNKTQRTELSYTLEPLMEHIINEMDEKAKMFYQREFDFVKQITEVSRSIPKNLKYPEQKAACVKALHKLKLERGCYLPSSLDSIILDVDCNSGTPLQSKERTPYLAQFLVCKCGFDKVSQIGVELATESNEKSNFGKQGEQIWQPTIFKAGDDVRQDGLALQIIKVFKNIFTNVGLDLFLYPYNVVAIDSGMGVIECIPDATSRDQLRKKTDASLYDYFIRTYGDNTPEFKKARRNFVKSMAAYSVVNFLLQIKDRHNANIMLDTKGHIMHIDFGFLFESSPGGNIGFEPDFKLTEEMLMIMGGKFESETFQEFVKLCVKAFLVVRPHQDQIIAMVMLMLDSGLPCFRGNTINRLRARFSSYASDKEAAAYMINVIKNSALNFRTYTYDFIQYFQNSIEY